MFSEDTIPLVILIICIILAVIILCWVVYMLS